MFQKILKNPYKKLIEYLKSGLSPREISSAIAWGTVWGTFPIPGTATTLSALTALWFKLNMGVIQGVNYGLTLVNLLLIVPFSMAGAAILQIDIEPITIQFFVHSFQVGWLHGLEETAEFLWHSVVGWLAIVPATSYLLYLLSVFFLKKRQKKESAGELQQQQTTV